MKLSEVSVPEVYTDSADFRFFLRWFGTALAKTQYDHTNIFDLYDPLRCPDWLLWMLADSMGFKYDTRFQTAFNRLVLIYFMSMIRHKGSKDGVTLAAEVNLASFNIEAYGEENEILKNRLEDTSIPVNAVYVTPHTDAGYIDVVYFSDRKPTDACIEYVRPLGMYLFQYAGVRYDARAKIEIDARLTNTNELHESIGPTHVGHYRREDYARMQRMYNEDPNLHGYDDTDPSDLGRISPNINRDHVLGLNTSATREPVYYRNSVAEGEPDSRINPGYRALYSLQLCNNDHVVKSLISRMIFDLGYEPQDVGVVYPEGYSASDPGYDWNLRYRYGNERVLGTDVYTIDDRNTPRQREDSEVSPIPAVNPVMSQIGDSMYRDTVDED